MHTERSGRPASFGPFSFRYLKVGIEWDVERQKDDLTGIS